MIANELHRNARLSDAQRGALLDRLDQDDAGKPVPNRRTAPRMKFRKTDIQLHVVQPGGGTTDCTVASRDLSATGMSFLYWGFLHAGTMVRVVLRKRLGGEETVAGKVVWCRHIYGVHHLVGIKFSTRIFPKLFVDPSEWGAEATNTSINPEELAGKVLLVDDQEIDRLLFKHHLQTTKLEIVTASTAAEALAQLQKEPINLLFCELNLTEIAGEDALKQFRASGYKGRMVIITAETSPPRLRAATTSGAVAVVQKPYEAGKLLSTISQWLDRVKHNNADALYSDQVGKPGIGAMLQPFVIQVQSLAQQLHIHIDNQSFDLVRRICQTLKGTGSGYGYPLLSEAATTALQALDASMAVTDSMPELFHLESICKRLSAATPS